MEGDVQPSGALDMKNAIPKHAGSVLILLLGPWLKQSCAQTEFEFANNWLQWVSFISGHDEGIDRNLSDNFAWMRAQGYTHLRFFGIYPNGLHAFPCPTLDANLYPTDPLFESVLPQLVAKANQYGITINFDGWEVIAESNGGHGVPGVDYMTEDEVAQVVRDVLSFGVTRVTEEQFGSSYLYAIQSVTQEFGAIHESTSSVWWAYPGIADEQLGNAFSFYPYDQQEADALWQAGSLAATLGVVHVDAEGAHHYGKPFSLALGSFGSFDAEHWKNAALFAQIQHRPERFSVEEADTDFTIGNPSFNFMEHVGNDLLVLAQDSMDMRPIANFVVDSAPIPPGTSNRPTLAMFYANCAPVVNTLTLLGYRVVTTVDSVMPDAAAYFIALAGGSSATTTAPFPDYVEPLLAQSAVVFVQPAYGIPDANDAADWQPLRAFFGLPGGDTQTVGSAVPVTVSYAGAEVRWSGYVTTLPTILERIPKGQVDTTDVSVPLSAQIGGDDVALLIQRDTKILINSSVLHLEASYVLTELLGGPLNRPATADVVVTGDRVLIYAERDGAIDLDIPWDGDTRVTRYGPTGNQVENQTVLLNRRYAADLSRGEFVYLRNASETMVPAVGTWGLVAMALLVLATGTAALRRAQGIAVR